MRSTILVLSLFLAGCSSIPPARTVDLARGETARVPILLYHHIQDLPDNASDALRRWTLTPDQFVEHMDWVAQQGFDVITMAQMNEHLKHGAPLPAHPHSTTLKDAGYESATIVSGSNLGYLYREDRSFTVSRIAIEGDMTLDDVAQSVQEMKEQHGVYQ